MTLGNLFLKASLRSQERKEGGGGLFLMELSSNVGGDDCD